MSEENVDLAHKPPPVVAATIADQLGEKLPGPRKQIAQIVWALGRTQACQLLKQTLQIEVQGGMLVTNGNRRRSPGGVFFHLAYTIGKPKEGKTLARPSSAHKRQKATQTSKPSVQQAAVPSPFVV